MAWGCLPAQLYHMARSRVFCPSASQRGNSETRCLRPRHCIQPLPYTAPPTPHAHAHAPSPPTHAYAPSPQTYTHPPPTPIPPRQGGGHHQAQLADARLLRLAPAAARLLRRHAVGALLPRGAPLPLHTHPDTPGGQDCRGRVRNAGEGADPEDRGARCRHGVEGGAGRVAPGAAACSLVEEAPSPRCRPLWLWDMGLGFVLPCNVTFSPHTHQTRLHTHSTAQHRHSSALLCMPAGLKSGRQAHRGGGGLLGCGLHVSPGEWVCGRWCSGPMWRLGCEWR